MNSIPFSRPIESIIGIAATQIAKAVDAHHIISVEHEKSSAHGEANPFFEVKVILFKRLEKGGFEKHEYKTKIKKPKEGSIAPMKELLMEAIAHRYIQKGERVVCTQDESMGSGYKGMLFVFDVDKLFFDISRHKLAENIKPEVIESVMDIALELSKEGREGRKIGTAFIIGDSSILKHTKQLIINPFSGLEESERNISDPNLRETIKEFSQLDGVFIVNPEGTLMSAGTYLNVNAQAIIMPGMGTRHRNCAAITRETDAVAVAISESGGKVRVFKNGRVIMSL